jgi:hypothetical protein
VREYRSCPRTPGWSTLRLENYDTDPARTGTRSKRPGGGQARRRELRPGQKPPPARPGQSSTPGPRQPPRHAQNRRSRRP